MTLDEIYTRDDLVAYIKQLEAEIADKECNWENKKLEHYLEAMSAWVNDMDGLYANLNLDMNKEPIWRLFARILQAATIYE